MIKSKLMGFVPYVVLITFFLGVFYYQNTVINRLADRVTSLSENAGANAVTIQLQEEAIRNMTQDSKIIMTELEQMQRAVVRSIEENNRKNREYDSYRGRLHEVSLQRPSLIERRANAAFSDVMQTIARETTHGDDN